MQNSITSVFIISWFNQLFLLYQKVKTDVVQLVRKIGSLEQSVEELDVKIGLLVQNRISMEVCAVEFQSVALCNDNIC